MKTVGMFEARRKLSALLERVRRGEEDRDHQAG